MAKGKLQLGGHRDPQASPSPNRVTLDAFTKAASPLLLLKPNLLSCNCSCPGWSRSGASCGSGSEPQELHQAEPEQVRAESFCCLSEASFCTTRAPFLLDSIHTEARREDYWKVTTKKPEREVNPFHLSIIESQSLKLQSQLFPYLNKTVKA